MPNKYHALVAEEINGNFKQSVKKMNTDDLPKNDVLVRVYYSSLNYKDALSATGHKAITKQYPFTPGIDAAGVIESSRDTRFKTGDKVIVTSYDLGMNTPGGFGQFISVPADWVIPLPDGLTLKESMMTGTSGITAAMGAEKIIHQKIKPENGDVLVTGATGAVGSFAVALLAHLGYRVTAATGKLNQTDFLKNLGAKSVIHRNEIYPSDQKPLLSARWSAAIEPVGGKMLDAVIRQTKQNGVIACCGNVLGHELHTTIYPFILRGISLMGIDSGIALMEDRHRIWNKLSTDWKPSALHKISKEISLEMLAEEISTILKGGQVGKILIDLH